MSCALVVAVHLHDQRYHGLPEWPPCPARVFQALVAGAAVGSALSDDDRATLRWLEALGPPVIVAPGFSTGQGFTTYVPNNDLDAVGRDPGRTSEIRAGKWIRPQLLLSTCPFIYAWSFASDDENRHRAGMLCQLADRLYQFGRGVDLAWASAEILDDGMSDLPLTDMPHHVYRPSSGGRGRALACPTTGSLNSLEVRHAAALRRFATARVRGGVRQLFSQPTKPDFAQVSYASPAATLVYELREASRAAYFGWPSARVSELVQRLRDGAAARLRQSLPERSQDIERFLTGRKADGADAGPTSWRIHIIPLPSIGHRHADRAIRRILVEVPAECPLRGDDVRWAFSGLELVDPRTGEIRAVLNPADDVTMLGHYGACGAEGDRIWRTVTAAALPQSAARRRIDPARVAAEAKGGEERAVEQARAAGAVIHAMRHAGIRAVAESIRVQREPFDGKGERAEAFASGTRFGKERLWHVEVQFTAPVAGPLIIGDGRFLGLGTMAPVRVPRGIHVFVVESGLEEHEFTAVARALRRAVMARVQSALGSGRRMPPFFSGHEPDGSAAESERHRHLTFSFAPDPARLLVIAPHVLNRRNPFREETEHLRLLDSALTDFSELRAGPAGRLRLRTIAVDLEGDAVFATSRTWESVTPYEVTRHTRRGGAAEALIADVRAECRRCGLPEPRVTPRRLHGVAGSGLVGLASLTFEVAVQGPVVLGRSRYLGGGLFAAALR